MGLVWATLNLHHHKDENLTRISKFDLLIIALVSSVVFIGLGSSSLLDYDEGIYAQVSRQILQNDDWLTFTLGTDLWFEKPPLFIWLTAVIFKFFGLSEFSARLIPAVSSVLVILLTYISASVIFGRRVGLVAVIPLCTGYEFLRQARNGTTDMMLTLFIMAILTVYIAYPRKSPAYWYLVSVLFSLGFMVKFWAVLVVIIAIGINQVLEKEIRATLSNKHFWGALLVALLLILPWHLIMYLTHGQVFIDRYVLYDLIRRTTGPLQGNAGSPRYYFDRMSYDYAPWFLVLPIALAIELRRMIGNWNKTGVLLLFTACIFGIYSLIVGTKIFHYLTPVYPILSIFIANTIITAYDRSQSTAFSGFMVTSLIALITPSIRTIMGFLLLAGFITLALFTMSRLATYIRALLEVQARTSSTVFQWIKNVSSQLLTYSEFLFSGKGYSRLAVLLMCLFLLVAGVVRSRYLYAPIESPVEKIARVAGSSNVLHDETILGLALPPDYADGIMGPAAMFYSERPIHVAWSEEELFELTTSGPREVIMGERYIDFLNDRYEFIVLAKSDPFVYGVIVQKDRP